MSTIQPPQQRLASIDAYRGLVMFLMAAEVLELCAVSQALPENPVWKFLCHHQSHVPWIGCSLHDLIQPSFSFLVGVALPFSLASRKSRGHSTRRMAGHALWRAVFLVFFGIFLRSLGHASTYFTFEDTLTQIGLGYFFLFLLGLRPPRDQWIALVLILVGYWAAFALYPLPAAGFDPQSVGVPSDWPHLLSGFEAHWNKNMNAASDFDRWFLNLFPREKPFEFNGGGYLTLSFIPTLATMIIGLLAGGWMRTARGTWRKFGVLLLAGLIALGAGWGLGTLGVCPVVKRIWTPTWVLFSGGWCLIIMAAFGAVCDVLGFKIWAFPLMVMGANSIVAYSLNWLSHDFLRKALERHFGQHIFLVFGTAYEPLVQGACILALMWLMLYWLYRQRIFVRI